MLEKNILFLGMRGLPPKTVQTSDDMSKIIHQNKGIPRILLVIATTTKPSVILVVALMTFVI